jgi:hypothetical protein
MIDELLKKKVRIMFGGSASESRIIDELLLEGFAVEDIKAAITECLRDRKDRMRNRRIVARGLCVVLFLISLSMSIYFLVCSETHLFISPEWFGAMTFALVTFFLIKKPYVPERD